VPLDRFGRSLIAEGRLRTGPCRIVPEKGFHLALDAAKMAGVPLILGGKVGRHSGNIRSTSRRRFARVSDRTRRFVGALNLSQRVQLMARARCAIVPSLSMRHVRSSPLRHWRPERRSSRVRRPLRENIEHRRTGSWWTTSIAMARLCTGGASDRSCRVSSGRLRALLGRQNDSELHRHIPGPAALGAMEGVNRTSVEHDGATATPSN